MKPTETQIVVSALKLFNAVPASDSLALYTNKLIAEYGVCIHASAAHHERTIEIFLGSALATSTQLNTSFHKSWRKIANTPHAELAIHQMLHYITTYGTDFTSDFVYIPNEVLNVPLIDVKDKTKVTVIRGLSEKELVDKCLALLSSGVALKAETITDIFVILDGFGHKIDIEAVKNKEAKMIICKDRKFIPRDPVENVRLIVYVATGRSLLIKDPQTFDALKYMSESKLIEIEPLFTVKRQPERLASVFNRFKPIFLTIKASAKLHKRSDLVKAINRISKLSKSLHVPMSTNILNNLGAASLEDLRKQQMNLLENATFFQLARGIQYLSQSSNVTAKLYKIRNGKSYVKEAENSNTQTALSKIYILLDILAQRYGFVDKTFFIPSNVSYGLPTSEKDFIGNFPAGTKFYGEDAIALGVYWRNEGGARDLDLSAMSTSKIGWDARYGNSDNSVMFSGDMTNANPCAVEYIRASSKNEDDLILMNNVYSGNLTGSKFAIVVGEGPDIDKDYMMDPNTVLCFAQTETICRQSIIGMITQIGGHPTAILAHSGLGSAISAGSSKLTLLARQAFADRWKNSFALEDLLMHCGARIVRSADLIDKNTIDLSPQNLQKDSIISLFL